MEILKKGNRHPVACFCLILIAVLMAGCSSGGGDSESAATPTENGQNGGNENGGSAEVPDAPDIGQWEPAGYSAGGLFTAIEVDTVETGTVYAGSDVSGIYRSDDSGESWQHKSAGLLAHAIAGLGAPRNGRLVPTLRRENEPRVYDIGQRVIIIFNKQPG